MQIPKAKEIMAHAQNITDKRDRLRFIEIQMDAASALSGALWDIYSIQARKLIDPVYNAAHDVCEYDWSDNDDDAVETMDVLRRAINA